MILNKKATSIVEAMIVMLIIVSGVTGMYNIFSESINLSTNTTNKIQAIQIAKQGIEGYSNIRETNWILFSSDYVSCWNTLSYNSECIGATNSIHTIEGDKSYIVYKDTDNRRYLNKKSTGIYTDNQYQDDYKVGLDYNGIYTQTGIIQDIRPLYTRELKFSYIDTNGDSLNNSEDEKLKITSIVQWIDNTSTYPHIVKLEQIFTNWKK